MCLINAADVKGGANLTILYPAGFLIWERNIFSYFPTLCSVTADTG